MKPEVKWYFKDKELTGDRHVSKVKKMVGKFACTLIIKVNYTMLHYCKYANLQNPTLADQGIYKVVATNKNGTHSVEQGYVGACTADQVYK